MSITEERKKYIRKLDYQIRGMSELLDPKFQEIISAAKLDEIGRLKKKAENIRRKLEENEFEIAIIGLEKAGKSTFANALMGIDILPSMDARCTYTSTSIRYGNEDIAEVTFFTRSDFSKKFTDSLVTMGIEHAENLDFATIPLSKYQEYFEALPNVSKNAYRANVNEDVENIIKNRDTIIRFLDSPKKIFRGSEQLESTELKNFIQNPAYAVAVKEIIIRSSKLVDMQNAVIYDVPGFDSPTQMHKDQTIKMMKTADVMVLIANAGKPSLTGPQLEIFKDESDDDGIPFNEKIFVFGNKADTANDAIEQNLDVLKDQLRKYRIVRSEILDERLVIGSARAKLESAGKLEDTGIVEKLKSKGIGNGIDEIHAALEKYNDTERFETIKKRVNRIYTELESVLSTELEALGDNSDSYINFMEISGISTSLLINSQNKIKKELERLHAEIPNEFEPEPPLEAPLASKLSALISEINSERYCISDEEKETAKNSVTTTSSNISVDSFEASLRKKKYGDIYEYFTKTIVNIAIETHDSYDSKIHDIFMDALSVSQGHPYYDEISEKVKEYLFNINSENKEGYYRSLAERFATDLFEVLIRQNFGGRDRWNAFDNRKTNIYSLGIFYTDREINVRNEKQPMLYSMLFHDEFEANDELTECVRIYAPTAPDGDIEKLKPYLTYLEKDKKENAKLYLSKVCEKIREKRPDCDDKKLVSALISYFRNDFGDDLSDSANDTSADITKQYYDERCSKEGLNSDDSSIVCAHINKDIDILGHLLLKAVVPAIQIDKAFVYYEISSIENILRSVDMDNSAKYVFDKFVNANVAKIAYGQLANIETEEKKRRLRQEMCSEIRKILGEVKNYNE
ncbi:MAG: dynamin family protein [Ruminococcus sp.]|nr:dynamin family protein [Ruminococcus sp.]